LEISWGKKKDGRYLQQCAALSSHTLNP